jgi:hypothetical protein
MIYHYKSLLPYHLFSYLKHSSTVENLNCSLSLYPTTDMAAAASNSASAVAVGPSPPPAIPGECPSLLALPPVLFCDVGWHEAFDCAPGPPRAWHRRPWTVGLGFAVAAQPPSWSNPLFAPRVQATPVARRHSIRTSPGWADILMARN